MQLDELFIKLGFKADNTELDKYSKSAQGAKVNLLGIVAAATATVMAMEKIAESTAHAVNNLQNFNAQTGLSIGKLQNLQITAQLQNIGLSANDVSQSVQTLQSNLANIRLGQGNVAPFQIMGIDVMGQNAFGVIDQIREKIKGLDDMTATNLIQQMGLNPQMITMLRMSKDEFAGLNSQIALTYDERQKLEALGIEIKKTQLLIEGAINKAIAKWSPTLIGLAQFIQNIVYALKRLNLTIPIILIGLGGILKMFGMLNKETLGWTLALTSLFLLLDDYAVWAKGGLSLFDYSGIEGFFKQLSDGLSYLDKYTNLLQLLVQAGSIFAGAWSGGKIGGAIGGVGGAVTALGLGQPELIPSMAAYGAGLGATAGSWIGGGTAVGVNIAGAYNASHPKSNPNNITQNNSITVNSSAARGEDVARGLQVPLDNATQTIINQGEGRY